MIRRPHIGDLRIVGHYVGVVINGLGGMMAGPLLVALLSREWSVAVDFVIGASACFITGYGLILISRAPRRELSWMQGMLVAGASYLAAMLLAGVPYYLSGHWKSYLDISFDTMSGLTTTGLTLIQDLDHLSNGINMWRHLLSWLGGQGMVVLALSFLVHDAAGAFKMYVSEAKDERLLPNVVHTARAIWFISVLYLVVGTLLLWVIAVNIGMGPWRGFLHALWVYMAGWSTGGFAPQSQNILYYHSGLFELGIILFMVAGSLNFALHYTVWMGKREELLKNIEIVTFTATVALLSLVTFAGLARTGVYASALNIWRKGFFILVSGHTGTGYQTVYGPQFARDWGDLAMLALISAMLFGGSAVSTAGGFKALRIGVLAKSVVMEIKRMLSPESAVIVEKFHYLKALVLEEGAIRQALLIVVFYLIAWGVGTAGYVLGGFPMAESLFESASTVGNVGLSTGITTAAMPAFVKVADIGIMWAGRMEFMAVLAMVGLAWAGVRGK